MMTQMSMGTAAITIKNFYLIVGSITRDTIPTFWARRDQLSKNGYL